MLITVTLPPYPHRLSPGLLKLLSDTGTILYTCPCLGKSDLYMAIKHGNPNCIPVLPFGDTPTGEYSCVYTDTISLPGYDNAQFAHSYGLNGIVAMVGVSGDALTAYQDGKRSGIDIHGGDPLPGSMTGLRVTDGCVRIANQDMNKMSWYLKSARTQALRCMVVEISVMEGSSAGTVTTGA